MSCKHNFIGDVCGRCGVSYVRALEQTLLRLIENLPHHHYMTPIERIVKFNLAYYEAKDLLGIEEEPLDGADSTAPRPCLCQGGSPLREHAATPDSIGGAEFNSKGNQYNASTFPKRK